MIHQSTNEIRDRLLAIVDLYRGMVLDSIQLELQESPNWPQIRSRLLKLLGDRGLVGQIKSQFNADITSGGNTQGSSIENSRLLPNVKRGL